MAKSTSNVGKRPERRAYLDPISVEDLLGRIVINWNNCESACRELLKDLCGRPSGIDALTAELNGQSLYHALRAIAPHSVAPEIADVVCGLAEAMDRLREHRNYYVHGANQVTHRITGKEALVLSSASAKASIKIYHDHVDKKEMYNVSEDCTDLALQAHNAWAYLWLKKTGQAVEVPDIPSLPPRLERTIQTRQ